MYIPTKYFFAWTTKDMYIPTTNTTYCSYLDLGTSTSTSTT